MNTVNETIAQKDPAAKDVQERIVSLGHAPATVEQFKQMVGCPEAMRAHPTENRRTRFD